MNNKVGLINFLSKNKSIILTFIFVLFYISLYFLIDFSNQSLVAHDEGLYARRARLIENSDNWFLPPFSSPHHKTLGSYWLIALSIRLFGTSELALRLPSIITSFACLISTYLISLKITGRRTALISIFSLSSMPLWIQYSRYASPDIPFVLSILLVILFFLHSLESSLYFRKCLYILASGLFISTSFFIRSYMAFVPLIGLSPFIFYNLVKQKIGIKLLFTSGILLGFIPTFLNLYLSFQKFGVTGNSFLFDFAKEQAIGDLDSSNLFLLPLNYIYSTFPIGMLLIILIFFIRSETTIRYPLLTICYPFISLVILLSMSTSYIHYYLFLLPSLCIVFSFLLSSKSFRFTISKLSIKYILSFLIFLITSSLLIFVIYYNNFIIEYSNANLLVVYLLTSILVLSYITAIRFILDIGNIQFNLIYFFYNLVIPQYISLSLFFNFGILGNPNFTTKNFLRDRDVSRIINSNTIYLLKVDTKIKTLLRYYLPYSSVVENLDEISNYKYLITSDINSLNTFKLKRLFKPIKKFDKNILLMNIGE